MIAAQFPLFAATAPAVQAEAATDAAAVRTAWGLDESDVPPDPAVRYGVLPNGMRYALRHNDTPRKTAVMRLVFRTGSIDEEEDQRGVAHFVEHMAFNGTTNVPEGEMVKMLERLGLAFGADTNAYTGYDETGYMLDLPNVAEETVDAALFLLRETASEISFDPGAIDRERGVVLSELRSRTNYAQRNADSLYEFTVPDTRIATRKPIGLRDVIENVTAERMRAFYDRNYTPGRATLVIVGDLDLDALEAKILETFSSWKARQGEFEQADPGTVDLDRGDLVNIFVHPAISEVATVIRFSPLEDLPDSIENRRTNIVRSIGYNIIGRRLASAAREEDAPFIGASVGRSSVYDMANQSVLTVATRDGEWQRGVAAAEQIVRAALEYGFSDAELAEQVANFRTAFENRMRGAGTRRSDELAQQIIATAEDGMIVSTPESQLDRFTELEDIITPDMVLQALRADFVDLDRPLIHLSTKSDIPGGERAVLAAYAGSRAIAAVAPTNREAQAFAYTDFGPAGAIVKDERIEDLGIRTIRFANNVRLNIKQTDFEEDRVQISLRIDGGDLIATRDNPEATSLMNIFVRGGLEAHSLDDLYSILAGRSVSLRFGSGDDYFGGYLVTTPQDLELQMQLLAAYTLYPGYRSEAIAQYRSFLPSFFASLNASPEAAIGSHIGAILSDDDPRFSLAEQSVFAGLTFDDLKAAITDRLQHGAIEIGIVGDVDEETAISVIARTFGALPEREAEFRDYPDSRQRHFTDDRVVRTLFHDGEADQAVVQFYWPTTDSDDFMTDVRLKLLAELLQLKVTDEIRERMGASYSPRASSFTSSLYPGYGYIEISTNVANQDVPMVSDAVRHIAANLSKPADAPKPDPATGEEAPADPISADEMLRARQPIVEGLATALRENSAWIRIVDEAQSEPQILDRFRESRGAYEKIQTDDLLQLAREYLDPDRALVVRALHSSLVNSPLATPQLAAADKSERSAGSAPAAIAADYAEDK